jgi:hypothetical protein
MANDGQSKSNQALIGTVAIVFLVGLITGGFGGYLLGRRSSKNVKMTVETPELEKVVSEVSSQLEAGIESAKWSEGKAMMGSIATAIRAYCAEVGPTGPKPTSIFVEADNDNWLGFERDDLTGRYFGNKDFSFKVTAMEPLEFTITCVAGKSGIPDTPANPSAYTLNQDGLFKPVSGR